MPRAVWSKEILHEITAPWLVALLLLHALPFLTRPALIAGDEPHFALMAHSIATDGDFDLADEYAAVERGSKAAGRKRAGTWLDQHVRTVGDREVFAHPLGLPLLAAPLLALQQAAAPGSAPDLVLGALGLAVTFCALLAGWRLLVGRLGSSRRAAVVAFGAYFSSPLWYYSRTFFTEPYTWSWAVLALASLARGKTALASLFLALTLATKETALLILVPVLVGVAWRLGSGRALRLAVGPAIVAAVFFLNNLRTVGEALVTYQPFAVGSPMEGAAGLLFGARHGLAWFAPLLFVGAIAGGLAWWRGKRDAYGVCALAAFLGYFAVSALWIDWRGGDSFGPRLLVPALPALVVLLAEVPGASGSGGLRAAIAAAFVAGFTVQWCAALGPVSALSSPSVTQLIGHSALRSLSGVLVGSTLWLLLARFPDSGSRDRRGSATST